MFTAGRWRKSVPVKVVFSSEENAGHRKKYRAFRSEALVSERKEEDRSGSRQRSTKTRNSRDHLVLVQLDLEESKYDSMRRNECVLSTFDSARTYAAVIIILTEV